MSCQARSRNAVLHRMRFLSLTILLSVCAAAVRSQTIERPQAFDSAQRIVEVTPALAQRLHLQAPAWPAHGDYHEARLYSVEPGGGFVLVIQQSSGALERYSLTDAERITLRGAIDAGMSATGRPSAESANDIVSEPAGNAFARHQTALAATIYAPLAASLATDGSVAGALYLLVTGGTFFATYAATQSMPFTRAQSALAADLGLAAAANGFLVGYAATGGRIGAFVRGPLDRLSSEQSRARRWVNRSATLRRMAPTWESRHRRPQRSPWRAGSGRLIAARPPPLPRWRRSAICLAFSTRDTWAITSPQGTSKPLARQA